MYEILVVEDNPAEATLMQRLLESSEYPCKVTVLNHPHNVLPFLRRQGEVYKPHLVLLDLMMPYNGGSTVIELKVDPMLEDIPIVVVTALEDEDTICKVYRHGASGCLRKPRDLAGYEELFSVFMKYWFNWTRLPKCK